MRYNTAVRGTDVCNFSFLVLSSLDKWLKQWFSLPLLESPPEMSPIPFLLLSCNSSCRWCFSWAINIGSFPSKISPRCCALEISTDFWLYSFQLSWVFFLLNFEFLLLAFSSFCRQEDWIFLIQDLELHLKSCMFRILWTGKEAQTIWLSISCKLLSHLHLKVAQLAQNNSYRLGL